MAWRSPAGWDGGSRSPRKAGGWPWSSAASSSELDDFRESMAGRWCRVRVGFAGQRDRMAAHTPAGGNEPGVGPPHYRGGADADDGCCPRRGGRSARFRDCPRGRTAARDETPAAGLRGLRGVRSECALWKGSFLGIDLLGTHPSPTCSRAGQFTQRWQQWLAQSKLRPQVVARVSSFTDLARVVLHGHAAAVLPEMAAVDFDPKKFKHERIAALKPRTLALISNARSLDRVGIRKGAVEDLSQILRHG